MMLNTNDLNVIQGLLHYCGEALADKDIAADITLIDANGDKMGDIQLLDGEYQFIPEGGA